MKSYKDFKKQLLNDKETKKVYKQLGPEFALMQLIIEKRIKKGLTQAQLAKKVGTQQSAISRLEQGTYNPTLAFLQKVATALDTELRVSLSAQR